MVCSDVGHENSTRTKELLKRCVEVQMWNTFWAFLFQVL